MRYFFSGIAVITVVITRIFLWFTWNTAFMQIQKRDSWHHMYTGIIIFFLSYVFASRWSPIFRAVGVGLFLDEVVHAFHLMHLMPVCDYWSIESILATILGLVMYSGLIESSKHHAKT